MKKENRQDLLISGKEYDLWREGEYIGRAIYTHDANIGESFIKKIIENGKEVKEVYIADEWKFVSD